MKILIAPDKFKGTLESKLVAQAIQAGLLEGFAGTQVDIDMVPLADGGDGTVEVLTTYFNSEPIEVDTVDPIGRAIKASYSYSRSKATAFIEMASASGLRLLKKEEYNVLDSSSRGTGIMILDALEKGATKIVLGIGGSATNDLATGAAAVLGYEFLDAEAHPVSCCGKNLSLIESVRYLGNVPLQDIEFVAICDVTNPLTGIDGAAYMYAPQKGATHEQVAYLDRGLHHTAMVICRDLKVDIENMPGSGAGGGFGGGAVAFFHGKLQRGIDMIFELSELEKRIMHADIIITGEGRIDQQTAYGKVVGGVGELARRHNKTLLAIVGEDQLHNLNKIPGLSKVFALLDFYSIEESVSNTYECIRVLAREQIAPVIADLARMDLG